MTGGGQGYGEAGDPQIETQDNLGRRATPEQALDRRRHDLDLQILAAERKVARYRAHADGAQAELDHLLEMRQELG